MRENLYSERNKIKQDVKVSHMLQVSTPKRERCRQDDGKSHDIHVTYKVNKLYSF